MKTIQLNPKQLSKLLNVDLDKVINEVIAQKSIRMPHPSEREEIIRTKKRIAKTMIDCNELKIMQQSDFDDMRDFDLMAETIKQLNENWKQVMYDVCHNDTCIRKIGFYSNFTYYDAVLEDEPVKTITDKLSEYHFTIYGNETNEYKAW